MTTTKNARRRHRGAGVAASLAIAASLLASAPAAGQAAAETPPAQGRVTLAPHWRVGDHAAYLVTHRSVEAAPREGEPAMPDRRSLVTLDVRAVDAQGYVVDWQVGPPPGMPTPLPTDPEELALVRAVLGMPLKLRIDAQGRVIELLNWREVRELSDRVVDLQVKTMKARGMSPEVLARMADQQRARMADEVAVRHSRAEDANTLLRLLGHAYERTQSVEVRAEVASPWGGDPMQDVERFELTGLDDQAHVASARMTVVIDPAVLREQYRAMLAQAIRQLGSHGAELDARAVPAIDLQMVFEATVDDASGWPRTARCVARAQGAGLDMEDTVVFERQ